MPPNLGGFFMVRSYYPSECHADYFDFERIEALKPAIEACGISTLSQSPMLGFHKQMDNRSDWSSDVCSSDQIAINGHIKFNLTIPLQQLNGLETLVIIMVANKYAFLQITRRRFLNEWEAFKKVISRRNIRRRITIPLTLSNLKLLRRITRTGNILHRNFTRRQVAIQNRVASNIGISQSTFSVKVLNLFSRSRRKTNKRKSKHSAMLRNKETRQRMFIGLLNTTRNLAYGRLVSPTTIMPRCPKIRANDKKRTFVSVIEVIPPNEEITSW